MNKCDKRKEKCGECDKKKAHCVCFDILIDVNGNWVEISVYICEDCLKSSLKYERW